MRRSDYLFYLVRALERSCFHDIFPALETDREMSGPEKNENLMEIFPIIPLESLSLESPPGPLRSLVGRDIFQSLVIVFRATPITRAKETGVL